MDNLQGEAPQLCERWCLVHPLLRYILQTLSKLCKSIWLSWISKSALYHEIPMFLGYHNFPMIVFFLQDFWPCIQNPQRPKRNGALSPICFSRSWASLVTNQPYPPETAVAGRNNQGFNVNHQAWGTVMVELRYLSCSWKWELTESTDS
jgi:hypothetical protein